MSSASLSSGVRTKIVLVPIITDNRDNGSLLKKLMANRCSLSALLKEFSEQLRHTGIRPEVRWSRRETNAEKDRLANGDSTGFSPSLRVRVFPLRPPWNVLNEALEMGAQAEEQKKEHRASKALEIFTRGGDTSGSWRRSSAS